jgi:uncharacterized protein (TIGR03382 family)
VGNPLVNAALHDGAVGSIFVNSESFVHAGGQAGAWGFFDNDFAGRQITPLLLTKAGAQWEILGVGTTRTSDASGAQNFDFGLVAGSDATGPGVFLGWKDGGQGTNNAGVAEYSDGGRGWVEWFGPDHTAFAPGDTLSTNLFLNRTYSLNAASTGGVPGESVGNPLGNRNTVDGASGSIFVLDDPFTIEESTAHVTEWALFTNQTAGTQITPLILAPDGAAWEIVGIGTTRTVTNDGVQVFDFDLIDGSDAATAGLYFGWKDGGLGVDNTGVAEWTNAGPGHVFWLGGGHTNFAVGDVNGVALALDRTYSFQVFTTAPPPIPEPATMTLLVLAGAALMRRRK